MEADNIMEGGPAGALGLCCPGIPVGDWDTEKELGEKHASDSDQD